MEVNPNLFYQELAQAIKEPPKLEFIQGRHKVIKVAMFILAAISSACAKVPYISIALKAKPFFVGVGIATCDVLMWFVAEMNWAMAILEDIFKQNPFEEKSSVCRNATTGAVAFLLALISQLPAVAPAAKYNESLAYEAGATVALSGAILGTRGLQQSLQAAGQCCQKTEARWTEMVALREKMIEELSDHLESYLEADLSTMQDFASKLEKLPNGIDPQVIETLNDQQLIEALWDLVTPAELDSRGSINAPTVHTPLLTKPHSSTYATARWVGEKIAQTLGGCCTMFFEVCVGYYTYDWAKDKTHSWPTALALSILSMMTYAYMMGTGVAAIATGFSHGLIDRCTGQHQPTLAEKLSPMRVKIMKVAAIVMGAFATATTWIIWRDFFDEEGVWPGKGRKIVQYTAMANNVIAIGSLLNSSTLPAVDRQMENWLMYREPEERGLLVAYTRKLEAVIELLEMTPPELLQAVVDDPSNTEGIYAELLKEVRSAPAQREMMNYVA